MRDVVHVEMTAHRMSSFGALRHMWCAVIVEQIRILTHPKREDTRLEKIQARNWFGCDDFYLVCDLAGVDGGHVLRHVKPFLKKRIGGK